MNQQAGNKIQSGVINSLASEASAMGRTIGGGVPAHKPATTKVKPALRCYIGRGTYNHATWRFPKIGDPNAAP